jgi:hypothetical protein
MAGLGWQQPGQYLGFKNLKREKNTKNILANKSRRLEQ